MLFLKGRLFLITQICKLTPPTTPPFLWAPLVAQIRICLQCRRPGFNPWVRKIYLRREWHPTPVFLPGQFHGQRSLGGYSPWGHKELDMTEWLTLSLWASQVVKNPPANLGNIRDVGLIAGLGRSLKNWMATCFSILAWRIPGSE